MQTNEAAGREGEEDGAGGREWWVCDLGHTKVVVDEKIEGNFKWIRVREVSASAEPQRAFGPIREVEEIRMAQEILSHRPACELYFAGLGFNYDKPEAYQAEVAINCEGGKSFQAPTLAEAIRQAHAWVFLGEAPPTSGEAEQDHPSKENLIDILRAWYQFSSGKTKFSSNEMDRVDARITDFFASSQYLATPGATVQPQADARPDAAKRLAEYFYHNLNQGKAWEAARHYLQDGSLPPPRKGGDQ